ncbi:MAG: B12-binding domain-containing radical SAM protein [Pyrinomonadaceae bacterium]
MKVLLSTSPHVRHPAVLQNDFTPDASLMYGFAPVGLLSLAAVLRRDRPAAVCEIYDLNRRILSGALPLDARFYAAAAEDICSHEPDVVGFMTECDSYHHILQITRAIKQTLPDCMVVLGGPHASAVAQRTLEEWDSVDAVVIGEGEATFPELLDALATRSDLPVSGALIRGGPGGILRGGNRALIDHLDNLPVPAYEMYRPDPGEEIFIEVGRGCPFKCEFCSTAPFWGRRHRVKSSARILHEVHLVKELFGTTRVHFTHDLFTTDRNWVRAVCEALENAGAPVRWTCSARTDTVDEELLSLMARAGCNAIYFGVESGSQRILSEIRKNISLTQSFKMLEACRDAGITPNAGFIAGFPTEDAESLRETFDGYERALRLGCRPTHLFGYCPFADSSLYARLKELECRGHFVDLPLGAETDLANRQLVRSDPVLYGAYFRPRLPGVVPGELNAIDGVDEFSPLVEAALIPALELARLVGGMYEVYSRWLPWIHAHNDTRGAPAHRRSYGTPAVFATFVLEALGDMPETSAATLAVARAVRLNLSVAESASMPLSTTMASHRSLPLPAVEASSPITLNTLLSPGSVVATLALDYDVTPALLGRLELPLEEEPTYLVWQVSGTRSVRLLRVEQMLFDALEALGKNPATAGELFLGRLCVETQRGAEGAAQLDVSAMLASLESAAREGLIKAHHD